MSLNPYKKLKKKIKKKLKKLRALRTIVSGKRDGVDLELLETSDRVKVKWKSLKFNINYMFNGGEYNLTAKRKHNDKNPKISFNGIPAADPEINIDWKGDIKIYIVYKFKYKDPEGLEHTIEMTSATQDLSKVVKWFIKKILGLKI